MNSSFSVCGEKKNNFSSAFTLIELLVVIAVIAILSVVVVLSLNPAELLRRSRDSNRVSDLDTLTHAISLYQTDQGTSGTSGFMGTSSIIYVSLPDASSTCGSWNLPTSPTGYTYQCSSPPTYRSITGTGWLPLNFQTITTGNPLGQLPIDPTNASSTGLYYTYTTNGSQFEITSLFESNQYKAQYAQSPSIPNYPEVNARGSNLTINPLWSTNGLVGYWNLDEGTGTTALDLSGNGNGGTWQGTFGNQWTGGKVGAYAGQFNGTDNYVNISSVDPSVLGSQGSVSVWAYPTFTSTSTTGYIFSSVGAASNRFYITYIPSSGGLSVTRGNPQSSFGLGNTSLNNWYYITLAWNSSMMYGYLNGNLVASSSYTNASVQGGGSTIGAFLNSAVQLFPGKIDDVRIYNRTLSAAEVMALYNAEK